MQARAGQGKGVGLSVSVRGLLPPRPQVAEAGASRLPWEPSHDGLPQNALWCLARLGSWGLTGGACQIGRGLWLISSKHGPMAAQGLGVRKTCLEQGERA